MNVLPSYWTSMLCWTTASISLLVGCSGDSDRVQVYPVQGSILHRGDPAPGAEVAFYVKERSDPRLPIPSATAGADGSFRLTSYEEGDGAPAGEYRVTVVWPEPIPEGVNKEMFSPVDRLRGRYSNPETSGLEVTITEDDNKLEPFRLE